MFEEVEVLKTCKCGKPHFVIPGDSKLGGDDELHGFYFNCSCGSTIFIPASLLINETPEAI